MSTNPLVQARESRQLELWERTAAVAGRLNRAQAELVQIAAELITDRHWGDGGFKTPEHYLVVRAGLSPGHASDIVQVAKRRTELVEASAALDAGELSLDQVAVIARNVPPGYTTSVTHLARNATVTQLRRATSRHGFPATTPPPEGTTPADADGEAVTACDPRLEVQRAHDAARDAASEQRACARADLSMSYDSDGRFQLRYSAPATIGALVEQAVKEAKDALFLRRRDTNTASTSDSATVTGSEPVPATSRDAQDPRAGLPTYADALEEMATRSLAYGHLDQSVVAVPGLPAPVHRRRLDQRRPRHPPTPADPVHQRREGPTRLGNRRPTDLRRAVHADPARPHPPPDHDRDRGCRFPGCPTTRFVEIHHLNPWADGGPTDEHNQASLCTIHHDAIDRGDYTITGDPTHPDGLTITNRYGLPIRPPQPAETAPPPEGDPPIPTDTYHPPSGGPIRWTDLELPPDTDLPTHTPPLDPLPARPPHAGRDW